jgi:hypothetical protein
VLSANSELQQEFPPTKEEEQLDDKDEADDEDKMNKEDND